MSEVLKSKRVFVAFAGFLVTLLVVLIPDLEPYSDQLIEAVVTLVGVLIGGFSVQDALVAWKTGQSKYTNNPDAPKQDQ